MPTRPQIELSREELLRAEIPTNHVLVKVIWRAEGAVSKSGLVIGFNEDVNYEQDESFWASDLAEIRGEVVKTPKSLYFNPDDKAHSMPWEIDMELEIGDQVWYSTLEAKNSVQVLCEGRVYKSVPYQDVYVAKRPGKPWSGSEFWRPEEKEKIIPINGFVLLRPLVMPQKSHLDVISDTIYDKSRGIVSFIGKCPKTYLNDKYSHIDNLKVGDEVLLDRNAPLFYLENSKAFCSFDGDNQYWVCQRRRIACVINRK